MKKIFTLFCAMVLVLGANAAPKMHRLGALNVMNSHHMISELAKKPNHMRKSVAVVAATQETINATDLVIDDSYMDLYIMFFGYGLYDIYAAGYRVSISVYTDELGTMVGTFDAADAIEGTIDESNIVSGSITVAYGVDGYTVTGTVICENGTEYILDLSYVVPDASRTKTLTAVGGEFVDMLSEYGAWQAYYENDTILVMVTMYADQIDGTYTLADNYGSWYTYFAEINGNDTIWHNAVDANLTVSANLVDSVVTITGTLLCQNENDPADVPELTLNIGFDLLDSGSESSEYPYDEESADFNVDFAASEITLNDQYFAQYGDVLVMAQNAKGESIVLDIFDAGFADGTFTPGVYIFASTEENGTAFTGFYYEGVYPSYAGIVNVEGYLSSVWYLVSGTVTISAETIVVEALNSKGKTINSTISLKEYTAISNVKANAVKAAKVMRGNQLMILRNEKAYNVLGTLMK